jgi:hypothetical protein
MMVRRKPGEIAQITDANCIVTSLHDRATNSLDIPDQYLTLDSGNNNGWGIAITSSMKTRSKLPGVHPIVSMNNPNPDWHISSHNSSKSAAQREYA